MLNFYFDANCIINFENRAISGLNLFQFTYINYFTYFSFTQILKLLKLLRLLKFTTFKLKKPQHFKTCSPITSNTK